MGDGKHDQGLARDSLGLAESTIMGIAGTAPAYSMAAATATLVAGVGALAPASLLYCGLVMFGVAFAYQRLNRMHPDAGASYAWVGRVFHPVLGFFAGWSLLAASAIFMVSGTIPAATATLALAAPSLADSPGWVALVAAGWLVAVSVVVVKGIKLTSYTQIAMTVTEVAILVVVIVAAGIEFAGRPAHAPATLAFSPAAFTPGLFATGALTALFFYWGWDVTVNLTEETRDPGRAPGRGSVLAMVAILMLFVAFAMVALMALTDEEIAESSTNVVFAVAEKLFPRPWSYVAIVAVMLSTVGTLETSILQFTRTLYAKGRDGTLHPRYASLHPAWRTPWAATAVITGFGLLLLFLSSFLPTVGQIIIDSVQSIGFQVALYYGLAGFACAWHSRHEALRSLSGLVFLVVWPTASACVLWVIAAYSIPAFDAATTVLGLGGIAVGAVPLWLNRRRRAAGTKASS